MTLRLPPPIDTLLDVVRSGAGAKLMSGDKLVAEAQPIEIEVDVPPAPLRTTSSGVSIGGGSLSVTSAVPAT